MHRQNFSHSAALQRLALLLFVTAVSTPALFAEQQAPDGSSHLSELHVSAEASVNAVPDTANFTLGVTTTHSQPDRAMQQNSEKMREVLRFLRKKVPGEQLRTLSVQLRKVEQWNREQKRNVFLHYEANNRVQVSVHGNLKLVPDLIGGAIRTGANLAGNISLRLKDNSAQKTQAHVEAVRKLKQKAAAIAQAAGYRLGRIIKLQDHTEVSRPHWLSYTNGGLAQSANATRGASPPVEVGELTITAHMSAEFELLR